MLETKGQDKTISIEQSNHNDILNLERDYFYELENIFKSQDFIDNLKKMKDWINNNYLTLASWNKKNKPALACQRIINFALLRNLKQITGVYNSAISSDIAFETDDAIINIDSKTVSSTGNHGDFQALFFGPNQSSFKNKNVGSDKDYPGFPFKFEMPSIDNLTKKPVLTFFLMLEYTDTTKNFNWYKKNDEPNIRFICVPNGELSYLFNYDIVSNCKTYTYEKNKPLPESHNFENSVQIQVYTKKGFYNLNTKETWLLTPRQDKGNDGKKKYINGYELAKGFHDCRINFDTLEDRYDSNQTHWKGVSSWNIFDLDPSI